MELNRRSFVGAVFGTVPAFFTPSSLASTESDFWSRPRRLWLQRNVGGRIEEFRGVYFFDGQVEMVAYGQICHLLRDVRANARVQMSPMLLDILCGVQGLAQLYGVVRPLVTTSGYRTPGTNASTEGASRDSDHMRGAAWDGRLQGYRSDFVADAAKYLRAGGVGLYVHRDFAHVDDGKLRAWKGS